MRWPDAERIVRIDGKDGNSMLILREATGLDRKRFAHDYLSELLRAAIASAVAALDRYMHDLIVDRCIKLLSRPEDDIPKELRKLAIPVLETKRPYASCGTTRRQDLAILSSKPYRKCSIVTLLFRNPTM